MRRPGPTLLWFWMILTCLGLQAFPVASQAVEPSRDVEPGASVSFSKQVLPILQKNCQGCHQPAKDQGGLILTTHAALLQGGEGGPGVEPGQPDESVLLDNIAGDAPLMPPNGDPLSAEAVALIRDWIAQGAPDDTPAASLDTIDADHPPTYAAAPVITALAFSPDGHRLIVSGYREVLVHEADGSGLVARLVGQAQRIERLSFSPDGKILAAVGGSPGRFGEIQFWDLEDFELRAAVRSSFDTLYGGAWTPDGQHFAFGCADNSARVIDPRRQEEILRIDHHSDWVFGTAYSLDGQHLMTLGRDGAIKLTEANTGSFIDDIGKNYGELKVLDRHPRENQIVIGGEERIPRLYKVFRTQARDPQYTDFNLLKAFEAQPGPIAALAFSPDGQTIAVGGTYGEVRLYDVTEGTRKATLTGHSGGIYALAFRPDGTQIATAGFDGKVRLYNVESQELEAEFVPVPIAGDEVAALATEQEGEN
ncbi:hypothetical protein BH23PLA1_BH23PLA1_04480 [soil metagenome]